jgi:hypothetical protein
MKNTRDFQGCILSFKLLRHRLATPSCLSDQKVYSLAISNERKLITSGCAFEKTRTFALSHSRTLTMSLPQSTEEARTHIEQIRVEKGLDGPQSNTEDLEAALTMLVPPMIVPLT